MPIPTLVRLNGKMFTRNSVAARVNGVIRIVEIDSLEWSDEVATELVPGMNDGGPPLGVATGNYSCDASIGVYADAASKFEAAVLLGSPTALNNLSAAIFQFPITFREDVRTRSVILVNARIVGRPSRSVGNDGSAIVMNYKLQPTLILEDGKSLVNMVPSF